MSEKILSIMIKNGSNPTEAEAKITKHLEYVIRTYPEASVKEMAFIIMSLSALD